MKRTATAIWKGNLREGTGTLDTQSGALDAHRAGLEILRDCVDGVVCLAFAPPEGEALASA